VAYDRVKPTIYMYIVYIYIYIYIISLYHGMVAFY